MFKKTKRPWLNKCFPSLFSNISNMHFSIYFHQCTCMYICTTLDYIRILYIWVNKTLYYVKQVCHSLSIPPSFRKQNLESTIVCQVYHAMTYIYMCNRNQRNGDPRSAVCGRDLEVPRRRLDSPGYRATVPVFRNRILYKSLPG